MNAASNNDGSEKGCPFLDKGPTKNQHGENPVNVIVIISRIVFIIAIITMITHVVSKYDYSYEYVYNHKYQQKYIYIYIDR